MLWAGLIMQRRIKEKPQPNGSLLVHGIKEGYLKTIT
jgi:hypothetical protein